MFCGNPIEYLETLAGVLGHRDPEAKVTLTAEDLRILISEVVRLSNDVIRLNEQINNFNKAERMLEL